MGCMDRVLLERALGEGRSLADIGSEVGLHEATVGYWVRRFGLQAANRRRHVARGGLAEAQLLALVEGGSSIAEIAQTLDRSKATVRHWLRRYGLKTQNRAGRRSTPEVTAAKEAGLRSLELKCARHGMTGYVLDGRGNYRCRRCRAEAVTRRRRKVKETLVREAGGACSICGYSGDMRALHFHHVDPSEKRIEINAKGVALALDTLRIEAQKCVLLCANCHAEVESGRISVEAEPPLA